MRPKITIIYCIVLLSLILSPSIGFAYKDKKKADDETSKKENTEETTAASLIKSGQKFIKEKKYSKGIKEYEKALGLALDSKDAYSTEECYRLLHEANDLAGNGKRAAEYRELYSVIKTKRENEALQRKQKRDEIEISRLKEQKLRTELGLQEAQTELQIKDEVIGFTRDSLQLLDLINKETQSKIALLEKEKELKEIKMKEQKALLQNKELQIKEQDARLKAELYIIVLLVGGLVFAGALGFVLYRNFKQRKAASLKIEEQLTTIQHQHDNITNSINYAQRIQQAMLPQEKALQHFIPDSFILYKPKDVVSGDFYWFYNVYNQSKLNDVNVEDDRESISDLPDPSLSQKIIVSAVDCTGHGVPGALMSMIGYNLLNEIAHKKVHQSNHILNELHKGVRFALQQYKNENKDGMDMALCVIDRENKTLEFSGAKNPMVFIQDNELYYVKGDKEAIGGSQGEAKRDFTRQMINIEKPTWVYLFTDGYADQFGGPEGKKFMSKNMKELLLQIHQKPFADQKTILNETIENWRGTTEKQIDDMLVIGMRVS
jgi:serine phosphatase RsbU (regulator of sigma subunit)